MGVPRFIIMGSSSGAGSKSTAPENAAATLMSQGKERQFSKRDSVRLSNTLGKQLRTEIATGTQQTGQEALLQFIAADPPRMGADV